MYGFQGWVSVSGPYVWARTTSMTATPRAPMRPPRRWPIHTATAMAARLRVAAAASIAQADRPNRL